MTPRCRPPTYAHVGGMLATGLRDVTSDVAALDSAGTWVVVATFEGRVVCALFDRMRPAALPSGGHWRGPPPDAWTTSLDESAYVAAVGTIREHIRAGDVYQANLCRVLCAPIVAGRDPAALSAVLAKGNPAPFAATVCLPGHGLRVASASPELFLRRDGDVLESRPIKGTGVTAADLLPKDVAENVMIVDLVRNDLSRVCDAGTVQVPDLCRAEEHPGLVHLVSTVRGRLRDKASWPDILAATFPPGSVTGAPKLAALDIIRALESRARGPYCGALGWVDADRRAGALSVGIRTFWFEDGSLLFGTGAGITWDSDPRREWEETELKAARLLSLASSGAA